MSSKPGTWQPGQSGNPNGRPKRGLALTDVLREHMDASAEGDGVPRKQRVAEKLYELAMAGNVHALEYIGNRLDGKPTVALSLAGGEDSPLHYRLPVIDGGPRRAALPPGEQPITDVDTPTC